MPRTLRRKGGGKQTSSAHELWPVRGQEGRLHWPPRHMVLSPCRGHLRAMSRYAAHTTHLGASTSGQEMTTGRQAAQPTPVAAAWLLPHAVAVPRAVPHLLPLGRRGGRTASSNAPVGCCPAAAPKQRRPTGWPVRTGHGNSCRYSGPSAGLRGTREGGALGTGARAAALEAHRGDGCGASFQATATTGCHRAADKRCAGR